MTIAPELKITKTPGGEYTHEAFLELYMTFDDSILIGKALEKMSFESRGTYSSPDQVMGTYVHPQKRIRIEFNGPNSEFPKIFRYDIGARSTFDLLDTRKIIIKFNKPGMWDGSD